MLTNFNNPFIAAFSDELQKELKYKIYHLTSNLLPHYRYLAKNECSTAKLIIQKIKGPLFMAHSADATLYRKSRYYKQVERSLVADLDDRM